MHTVNLFIHLLCCLFFLTLLPVDKAPRGCKIHKLNPTGAGSTRQLIYSGISEVTKLRVPEQSRVSVMQTSTLLIEL